MPWSAAEDIGPPAWSLRCQHACKVGSLAEAVPQVLSDHHRGNSRFGTKPWMCQDQNVVFVLAGH